MPIQNFPPLIQAAFDGLGIRVKISHWLVLFLCTCSTVKADDLQLVVSGRSIHFGSDTSFNETNWGLGFEYDFEQRNNWIPLITGASFKDSLDNTSNYLGGGTKRRFLLGDDPEGMHIDAGVFAFVMTREDYKNNDPFPGVLPFLSIGNNRFAINITYVPKIVPKMVAFLYFQATIKIAEFYCYQGTVRNIEALISVHGFLSYPYRISGLIHDN